MIKKFSLNAVSNACRRLISFELDEVNYKLILQVFLNELYSPLILKIN